MAHDIIIYMPNRGQIETETVESLLRVATDPRTREIPIGVHFQTGDSDIHRSRNECAAHFLDRTDARALMFIDSDIVFEPNDIFMLWTTGLDLVAADYHVSRRSIRTNEERGIVKMLPNAPLIAPSERLPTGFMLIRRAVLERLAQLVKTYRNGADEKIYDLFTGFICNDRYLPDDFAFSERAVRAEFIPHLHRGIRLEHIGRKAWSIPKEGV